MALVTPTTNEVAEQIINQVVASTSTVTTLLPRAFTRFFSKVLAGVFMLLYKYAGWTFLQMFVRTASFSETTVLGQKITPLIEWGRLIGIGEPRAATQSELLLDIVVTNQTGSLVAGTQATSNKNGITYLLLAPVTLDAAIKQGTFRASSDVDGGTGGGTIGNLDPGDTLSLVNPLANAERDMSVDSVTTTGTDGETEIDYRQRVIDRFQKQAQGGSGVDYVIWGSEVSGVKSIIPYRGVPGFVDVYVEVDSSIEPDGIAPQDILDDVTKAITFEDGEQTRKPIDAFLSVIPITRRGFDVFVSGLNVPDSATVETAITGAVEQYFLDRGPYIDGVTPLPRRDVIQVNNIKTIVDSFATAAGGSYDGVTLFFAGTAVEITPSYALQNGEKAKASLVDFS